MKEWSKHRAFFDNVYSRVKLQRKIGNRSREHAPTIRSLFSKATPAPIGQLLYRFKRFPREIVQLYLIFLRKIRTATERLDDKTSIPVTRAILRPIVVAPSIKGISLNAVERPWTFSRIFLPGAVHQKSFCSAHAFERTLPTVHHRSSDLDYKFRTQLVRGKKWGGERTLETSSTIPRDNQ